MEKLTYLGPEGTFTEAALLQVTGAEHADRIPAKDAVEALARLRAGEVDGAMLPIENSIEGGVSATLDAIATGQELRIEREVVIPVTFVLAALPGTTLDAVTAVSTHPHAWAQTRGWAQAHIPQAEYAPARSTAAAAHALADGNSAAICSALVAQQRNLSVLAEGIEDNAGAVTRFVLVVRPGKLPAPTGADKTTVAMPLPEDRPGALMEILDQFYTRGVNLCRIESRPTGQYLGHYFFSIDAEGHILQERMADALRALYRISPQLRFMGSYPRADAQPPVVPAHDSDSAFAAASAWYTKIITGEP